VRFAGASSEARATTYAKLKRFEDAVRDYEQITREDPALIRAWLGLADAYEELDQYDKAVASVEKAIENSRDGDTTLIVRRGLALFSADRYDEASRDFNAVLESDSLNIDALMGRALLQAERGDFTAALADLNTVVEHYEKPEHPLLTHGLVHLDMGLVSEAEADYNRANELRPQWPRGLVQRAEFFNDVHRYEEALRDVDTAIDLDPENARAHLRRAEVYRNMGRFAESLEDYSRAEKLKADRNSLYNGRGLTHRNMGHLTDAIRDFSKVLEMESSYANLYNRGFLISPRARETRGRRISREPSVWCRRKPKRRHSARNICSTLRFYISRTVRSSRQVGNSVERWRMNRPFLGCLRRYVTWINSLFYFRTTSLLKR
jgi:tetratricopeptide (TPR) repeat protein